METRRDMTRSDTVRGSAAEFTDRSTAMQQHSANKVWVLRSKNPMEPPFHFVGVPPAIVAIAADEKAARAQAASSHPAMVPAGFATRDGRRVTVEAHSPWTDADLTSCEEPDLTTPGVIARDMGA